MSFGIGVGDVLATLKLADELKKRFAQAPSEFKTISGEIKSLWAVLHDLNDIPKEGLSVHQKSEMESIVQKGREVLLEIEDKLSKYNVLAFKTPNWKSNALRAWSRIKWDPAEVNNLRNRIMSCISLFNLVMGNINQDLTLEIGAEVRSIKGNQDIQLRNEMLASIYPIDPSERQRKIFNMRLEGAGKWLLESEEFLLWVGNEKKKAFMLCTGVPGAGKTVLASIIIDHLEKKYANDESIAVTYLYFDYRQRIEFPDLLSSLLRQLLQGNPGLDGFIADLNFRRQHNPSRLSEAEIKRELEMAISRCSEVFFLIDALDECLDVRVRRQFLIWIRHLLNSNGYTKIKVLATTRHEDVFGQSCFSNDLNLEIKASREDVEGFLDANLDILPPFIQRKPDLWKYIRNQIIESAGGMFLLARLYLNLLLDEKNEKRVRTLGSQLKSGSGAYDHAYNETMKRIEQQSPFSQDLAKRILGWVTFSARPLTAVELQDAIAIEIGEPEFDEMNITDIGEMISVCSGLVVLDETSNIVKLGHFTAQEYLKRTSKSWFTDVNEFLTDSCLTYLSFNSFDDSYLAQGVPQVQRKEFPFYQYSAHELGTHLRQSLGNGSLLSAFVRNDAKASRCMREMFGLSGTKCNFMGLHLASLFGLEHIMEGSSPSGSDFNVWDYLGRTPLTWAAATGNETVVKLLLARGADPNSATKENFTPLFYAAAYGHAAVVRLLIEGGANVNFENKSNETPIFFAAKGGGEIRLGPKSLFSVGDHALVMKLLLGAGANFDHANNRRETPLYAAAENGHEAAVKLLIERKVNINSNPAPLTAAVQKGHVKITKLLLESGANTPFRTGDKNLPRYFYALSGLSNSIVCEDESSLAVVLQEWSKPSFQDEFGRLPLHWAASRGDVTLVQRILNAGCTPNPRDIFGRTPLFAAVCRDRVNVVRVLLDHPDIEAQGEDKLGITPLQESFRRQKSSSIPSFLGEFPGRDIAGPFDKVVDLLKVKTGLQGDCLPHLIPPSSYSHCLPQAAFRGHCDVCLDRLSSSSRYCKNCNMITKDTASGCTVVYCHVCVQGVNDCPLCGQPF
ncbi:hypothetical protein N7494_008766 [Penicillium frequentans]|uniref:NACHT domain-containing protein n=1 Tax=Penicillium frequentans TaxID=3151616 RepID=A0AAD6CQ75_9EURO|nr:hypothetical protein N7494_008766 [Penicillium glabrum]